MTDDARFQSLFAAAGEAAGPGAGLAPPPPRARGDFAGASLVDGVVGLAIRFALIVQLWGWARANAAPVDDPLSWRAWVAPSEGLAEAAGVWTFGQVDAGFAAFVLLCAATGAALALAAGVFARLAGFLVIGGAIWHAVFVMPEAWPSNTAYGVLGLYLMMRGAGPFALDWVLARLARLG